jgi:signal transduction histidine kinase
MSSRVFSRFRPRTTVLVGLLATTVGLGMLLAYEAWDAARAERVTMDRALRDYTASAGREFQSAARDRLQATLGRALASATAGIAATPYDPLAPVRVLERDADDVLQCPDTSSSPRRYFRIDLRDGQLTTSDGALWPGAATLVDRVREHASTRATPEHPFALLPWGVHRGPELLALGVRYAQHGAPIAAYGLTTCRAAVVESIFADLWREHRLLPGRTGAPPNDDAISVRVIDPAGATVFARGSAGDSVYVAEQELEGFGGLRVRVALGSDAASRLLAPRPERPRLPVLLALLVLAGALTAVALLQMRREHELAQLRADFTSSVSHELRTPLAQILLFGETLSLDRARTDAERREAAETIVHEARRLMQMVDNVLQFSRARRARVGHASDAPPLSLESVLRSVAQNFRPLADAAGARLVVASEGDVVVLADEGAVRQIVLNLLDNATKYGPRGQTIRMSAERNGVAARLAVEDEGPGVPAHERDQIWDPWVRLQRDRNGHRGGTGIGLAVVRELAESLGGRVWVEDGGRGARFVVELRLAPQVVHR